MWINKLISFWGRSVNAGEGVTVLKKAERLLCTALLLLQPVLNRSFGISAAAI